MQFNTTNSKIIGNFSCHLVDVCRVVVFYISHAIAIVDGNRTRKSLYAGTSTSFATGALILLTVRSHDGSKPSIGITPSVFAICFIAGFLCSSIVFATQIVSNFVAKRKVPSGALPVRDGEHSTLVWTEVGIATEFAGAVVRNHDDNVCFDQLPNSVYFLEHPVTLLGHLPQCLSQWILYPFRVGWMPKGQF